MIAADAVRLWRRPGDLLWWLTLVAAGLAAGSTLVIPTWQPLVATLIAYRAGCVIAGGLRAVATAPALRRALGGSPRRLYAHHAVVPIIGVFAWAALTSVAWQMTPASLAVITGGAAFAVVRRATRPELPFDAPVYVLGQGGAVQPLLLFALGRGPIAAVLTGLAATLIG